MAQQLKEQFPYQQFDIEELGAQLNMQLTDQWGSDDDYFASLVTYPDNIPLPLEAYYPLYIPVNVGDSKQISFNGGLNSLTNKRPGVLRYLKIFAEQGNRLYIKVVDAEDQDQNIHSYRFDIVYNGRIISRSKYYPEYGFSYSSFDVPTDQNYVVRIYGERYAEQEFNINETISPQITVDYRN